MYEHSGDPLSYRWGEHYWKVEFDMDCSKTEGGWFELKAFVAYGAGWETDINQGTCLGSAGELAPFSSNNHMAKCGFLNRYEFSSDECYIDHI